MAKRSYNLKIEANVSTAKVDAAMKSLQNKYEKITIGKGITKNLNEASKATKTLGQDFLDTSKKVAKFGAITAVLSAFTGVMYKAVDSVLEMDKALTEFKKVSDLSGDGLKEFTQRATEAGQAVARTGAQMIEAATEFKKSGYGDEQALQLATVASLYQNIADSQLSAGDASSYIISQMKAFNLTATDAIDIIDKTNAVSNNFAVSSTDISSALTKSASSLATYGNTIDETIALITAGTEVMTGQAGKIGRGLRSAGANIVKMATSAGDLTFSINGATKSIDLFDKETGKMKNTYAVLSEVASGWDEMSAAEQAALALQLGGKTQIDTVTAVLRNFDSAVQATETSLHSSGSAMQENARYMESLEAKTNKLQSSFDQWSQKGAGIVGFLLDTANVLMEMNNQVDILSPLLVVAAAQFTGFSSAVVTGLTNIGVATALTTGGLNLLLGGLTLLIANIPKITDALTTTQAEQETKLADIAKQYDEINAAIKTEKDEQRLKILEAQLEVLKEQKAAQEQVTAAGAVFGEGVLGKGLVGETKKPISALDTSIKGYIAGQQELLTTTDTGRIAEIGSQMESYKRQIIGASNTLSTVVSNIQSNMDNLDEEDRQKAQAVIENAQAYLDWAESLGVFETAQNSVIDGNQTFLQETDYSQEAIDALSKSLDNIQDAYSAAQSALDEYNENGFISIDTYQSLMSLSPEYRAMLIDESGQLNLNADNVNNLTAAMIDELGAKQAMMLINTAGTSEAESEALMNVSDAASAAGQSLWDFVTAQAADKIVKGEATDALMSQVNAIKSWADAAKKGIGSSANYTGSKGVAQANKDATAAIRENIKALEKQKSAYETAFKFMQDKIQTEIDKLEEQKSIEEEFWDAKINALKEQNEAIEDQIELQQLQANLTKAKSKKVYRLQGGQFGYFEDTEAVSQAQAALDEYNRKKAYEDEIKRLEDQKKATIDSIETQIKYWEKYKDEWASIADTVEKEQDRMTAEMILGTNLEGENWKTRLTAASGYLDGYRSVVNQLVAENDRLNASNQSVSSGGGAGSNAGTGQKFKVVAGTSQGSKTLKDGFTSKSDAQAYLNSLDPRAKQFASVVAYAKGTMFAPFSSLANVDENGSELKVPRGRLEEVRYGDQIVPAQQSKNLMEISKYTPESFLNKAIARIGDTGSQVINQFDKLVLPNVTDANTFIEALKNLPTLAMQSGSVRA